MSFIFTQWNCSFFFRILLTICLGYWKEKYNFWYLNHYPINFDIYKRGREIYKATFLILLSFPISLWYNVTQSMKTRQLTSNIEWWYENFIYTSLRLKFYSSLPMRKHKTKKFLRNLLPQYRRLLFDTVHSLMSVNVSSINKITSCVFLGRGF